MNASRAWSRANRSGNSHENFRQLVQRKFTQDAGPGIAPGTFPPANLARGYTGLVNQEAASGETSEGLYTSPNPCRERDTVHGAVSQQRSTSSNGKAASSINSGKHGKSMTSGMPHGNMVDDYKSRIRSVRRVGQRPACVG
jgi:hypothetical protein